jgi:Flp pilus assembly pilin Flp
MASINRLIHRFVADDNGQDLIEYALLAALIGAVGVAVFPIMQGRLNGLFSGWESAVLGLWVPNPPSS